jgi:hypothetical protein
MNTTGGTNKRESHFDYTVSIARKRALSSCLLYIQTTQVESYPFYHDVFSFLIDVTSEFLLHTGTLLV